MADLTREQELAIVRAYRDGGDIAEADRDTMRETWTLKLYGFGVHELMPAGHLVASLIIARDEERARRLEAEAERDLIAAQSLVRDSMSEMFGERMRERFLNDSGTLERSAASLRAQAAALREGRE